MRIRPRVPRFRIVVVGLALAGVASVCWPISDTDREQARAAAVRLLTADVAVGQMPADLGERKRVFETQADERRAALRKVWAPGIAYRQARAWEDGIDAFHADPTYLAYIDNRYVVTDWRSVRRIPGGYFVTFRGEMKYRDAKSGGWVGSAPSTEHLTMLHVFGEWRLLNETVTQHYP